MTPKEELQAAFAILDAHPFKISKDNQPHTASFMDDNPKNPVQICDSKGNPLLLMSLEDYKAVLEHKPVSMGCKVGECLPPPGRALSGDFLILDQASSDDIMWPWQPAPSFDEFIRLEDACMNELLRGCILPAHLMQGAPFEENPLDTPIRKREYLGEFMPQAPEPPTLPKPLEYIHLTIQVPGAVAAPCTGTRLEAPTFELKGPNLEAALVQGTYDMEPPAITPTKLLTPSFEPKDPK